MSATTIQFATQHRVSCNLPIDMGKAKKELDKRQDRKPKKKPELSAQQLNLDDPQALSNFILQG